MKKSLLICCILLVTTVILFSSLNQAAAGSNPGEVLSVDQLMNNVDRHKGPIRVQGVVTAVVPEKHMIALVDTEQFKQCGILSCPTYLVLPVLWSGAMPSLKDAVKIEGEIKESAGKLVFQATIVEKLALQMGGAK
jgi:hypothetical protein